MLQSFHIQKAGLTGSQEQNILINKGHPVVHEMQLPWKNSISVRFSKGGCGVLPFERSLLLHTTLQSDSLPYHLFHVCCFKYEGIHFPICFIYPPLGMHWSMMQEASVSLLRDVSQIFSLLLWDIFLPRLLGHGATAGTWQSVSIMCCLSSPLKQTNKKKEQWSSHLHQNSESLLWVYDCTWSVLMLSAGVMSH